MRWTFRKDGGSLVAAILFFMLCGLGASMILSGALALAKRNQKRFEYDQKRLAVESAAAFLRDELVCAENAVEILEWEDDEIQYVYAESRQELDDSILGALIRARYEFQDEEPQKFCQEFVLSVESDAELEHTDFLQVKVKFWLDEDYQITALLSDMEVDTDKHCRRRLTVPAQIEHEETEEAAGSVCRTTIFWERGVIEKGVSDEEWNLEF